MDALALLRLQIEWGADEALDEAPVDRLHAPAPPPPTAAPASPPTATPPTATPPTATPPTGAPPRPAAAPPPPGATATPPPLPRGQPSAQPAAPQGTAAQRALAAAGAADSLAALATAIAGFDGCALRDTATKPVLPEGDPTAGLLLIGEAPGADEDRAGAPFAGQDGALLDRILASIGLSRAGVLLAPLIPWRPPGGRPPTPAELTVCVPFLHRLMVLAEPRHVVLFGPLAVRTLLDGKRRRPGTGWVDLQVPGLSAPVPALALPSLAMLRSTPKLRRDTWADLRRLRHALGEALTNS